MAKIYVAGAWQPGNEKAKEFAKNLGEQIVAQNHILLSGCRNEFDAVVAKAASDWLRTHGMTDEDRIVCYIVQTDTPVHNYGTILKSRLSTWDITYKRLFIPEPIAEADVVILVSGSEGTMRAANWARIGGKFILPVTIFGGAAEEIYKEETKDEVYNTKYADRVDRFHYEALNRVSSNLQKMATDITSLAERIISSKNVFVIMSFSKDAALEDAYESFKDVCSQFQYEAKRVDEAKTLDRIIPTIFDSIKKSAFVIADLSEAKPNVYYELGLAHGIKKAVITTARKDTPLPFDVNDIPTIFWESQKQLKLDLQEKIRKIALIQGR